MKLLLRHVTYYDNSKKRILVVNNNGAIGHIKLTVKSWNTLKKLGTLCVPLMN
jgi:hypothetical protein